jgi:glycerol uptake facilitator-like aquaporin
VATWDAVFYIVAQLAGGLAGVLLLFTVIGEAFGRPPVEFVVTVPGPAGQLAAFVAELFTSFGLMLTVLYTTNRVALMRYTSADSTWLFYGKAGGGWVGSDNYTITNTVTGASIGGFSNNTNSG